MAGRSPRLTIVGGVTNSMLLHRASPERDATAGRWGQSGYAAAPSRVTASSSAIHVAMDRPIASG